MVAAELKGIYEMRAKKRQKASGKVNGNGQSEVPDNCPGPNRDARDEAGAAVGVSGKSVDHASTVLEHT